MEGKRYVGEEVFFLDVLNKRNKKTRNEKESSLKVKGSYPLRNFVNLLWSEDIPSFVGLLEEPNRKGTD